MQVWLLPFPHQIAVIEARQGLCSVVKVKHQRLTAASEALLVHVQNQCIDHNACCRNSC
jgi:hypothetical protein